jgi:DNA-binding PadR family transcriptional regulator
MVGRARLARIFWLVEGWGGRHGMGGNMMRGRRRGVGGNMMRAGRMLADGELCLIALALIAERPRHGYEIIKVLKGKTAGWYSPSPGIVYPTLTYLERTGYVTVRAEDGKKLYTITDEGGAYLDENRNFVDAALKRLAATGKRAAGMRGRFGGDHNDQRDVPPLVRAALENLGEVATKRLDDDAEAEAKVVEVLARVAAELKKA